MADLETALPSPAPGSLVSPSELRPPVARLPSSAMPALDLQGLSQHPREREGRLAEGPSSGLDYPFKPPVEVMRSAGATRGSLIRSIDAMMSQRSERQFPHVAGRHYDPDTEATTAADEPVRVAADQRVISGPLVSLVGYGSRRLGRYHGFGPEQPARLSLPPIEDPQSGEQALYDQYSSQILQRIINQQSTYFKHGLHGFKRDVGAEVDPIENGVIPGEEVDTLFAA